MEQIQYSYILSDGRILYVTYKGKFYVTSHIVGHVDEITREEYEKLPK